MAFQQHFALLLFTRRSVCQQNVVMVTAMNKFTDGERQILKTEWEIVEYVQASLGKCDKRLQTPKSMDLMNK